MSDPKGHTILVMSGPEGPSLYLDDYRIAGPKPWGGGTVLHEFAFKDKDFIAAGVTLAPTAPDATHEWTTDDKHDYDWCRRCLLVRQANGSTDAKPCKGPAHVTLRAVPTPPDALVRAVIRLHDSLSPDETRGVLWRNVEDALYPRGASASDLAPPPDALGEALAQIDGERIRAEAELGGEPWERWRNQGVIAALGFAAAHVRAALEATP